MRNLTILLACLSIILFSCQADPVAELISDYEQRIGGAKTDLSLKIISLKETGPVTGADSLKFYEKEYKATHDEVVEAYNNYENLFDDYIGKSDSLRDRMNELNKRKYSSSINRKVKTALAEHTIYLDSAKRILGKKEPLNKAYIKLTHYQARRDSLLGYKYECNYSLLNPLLNNVKQELSKEYVLNKQKSKILSSRISN